MNWYKRSRILLATILIVSLIPLYGCEEEDPEEITCPNGKYACDGICINDFEDCESN